MRYRFAAGHLPGDSRAPGGPADRKRWIIARLPSSCQKCLQNQQSTPASTRRAGTGRRLVLASTSRYRRMLLERLGLAFRRGRARTPTKRRWPARRRRRPRCGSPRPRREASRPAYPDALIIGSDQVADCDGRAVGKPGTHERAVAQLARALRADRRLSHRGRAARRGERRCQTALVDVRSTFRCLVRAEIEALPARASEPYDCAGSVRSEALGIALFERIESDDPTALIGLPLIRLTRMLRAAGVDGAGATRVDAGPSLPRAEPPRRRRARAGPAGAHDRRRARASPTTSSRTRSRRGRS